MLSASILVIFKSDSLNCGANIQIHLEMSGMCSIPSGWGSHSYWWYSPILTKSSVIIHELISQYCRPGSSTHFSIAWSRLEVEICSVCEHILIDEDRCLAYPLERPDSFPIRKGSIASTLMTTNEHLLAWMPWCTRYMLGPGIAFVAWNVQSVVCE